MRNTRLLFLILFACTTAKAQGVSVSSTKGPDIQPESAQLSSTLIEPSQPEPPPRAEIIAILPEAPIAKPVTPLCANGAGKPCTLTGGRTFAPRFFRSRDEQTWVGAMSHPSMLVTTSLLVASFVMDYKTTRYCVDRHLGHEANPLMGDSRAQELAVGIGFTSASIWAAGKLKEDGDGKVAFIGLFATTALHSIAAAHNAVACGY
jgi:hypothetical protein